MQKDVVLDGCAFPPGTSLFHAHLWLFRYAPQLAKDPTWRPDGKPGLPYTGTGRYSHCRALIEMLIPSFEWHDFSEKAIRASCEHPDVAIVGAGGSGKSCAAAAYALIFALADIYNTAVLIASTTISAALQRIWKNISAFYSEMRSGINLGETTILGKPRPEIRAKPNDFAHGLFVIPVAQGDIQKAIDELKGRHPNSCCSCYLCPSRSLCAR